MDRKCARKIARNRENAIESPPRTPASTALSFLLHSPLWPSRARHLTKLGQKSRRWCRFIKVRDAAHHVKNPTRAGAQSIRIKNKIVNLNVLRIGRYSSTGPHSPKNMNFMKPQQFSVVSVRGALLTLNLYIYIKRESWWVTAAVSRSIAQLSM